MKLLEASQGSAPPPWPSCKQLSSLLPVVPAVLSTQDFPRRLEPHARGAEVLEVDESLPQRG